MPKSSLLLLPLLALVVVGCIDSVVILPENDGEGLAENAQATEGKQGLPDLCSGAGECNEFCQNNFGRCKEFCSANPGNPLCQKPFPFEGAGGPAPAAAARDFTTPTPTAAQAIEQATTPAAAPTEEPPVLKHLGVDFAPWDRATNRAGAFVFSQAAQQRDKLFLEFGARVQDARGGYKLLPTFEYVTAADADVYAVADGIVGFAKFQPETSDYEISIVSRQYANWVVYQDHIRELKVAQGDTVKAGQAIGKTGTGSGGLGRTEIQLGRSTGPSPPIGYCPAAYFDAGLRLEFKEKIIRHMRDWEEFKGNQNIFEQEKHVLPGCVYEAMIEENGVSRPLDAGSPAPMPSATTVSVPTPAPQQLRGASACQGSGPVRLSASPFRVEEILTIVPMGQMGGGHVTPVDHQYWHTPDWHAGPFHDILSPAKGVITEIQRAQRPLNNFPNASLADDYRIVIRHTCTFYSIFIHPKKLSPRVQQLAEFRPDGNAYVNIPVEAGEVIAYATATDFSVHNTQTRLTGFVTPALYASEEWKIHTVDPFDYFDEPLRSQLLAKNLRSAPPLGGKIDFDVDGKLVGNWFRQGTTYAGTGQYTTAGNYWQGHVAFTYNHIDPSAVMFSTGEYAGESKQFGIKGNAPDPAAAVGVESGLVKYELTNLEYFLPDNNYWDRRSFVRGLQAKPDAVVRGVVLVQLLEPRKLKLEVFPGKKAEEVSGFTQVAQTYER